MSETIVLLNHSRREFHTSAGVLKIGGSLPLPAKEAEFYLGYAGIQDAAKVAPQFGDAMAELRKENAELKARIIELEESQGADVAPRLNQQQRKATR